MIIKFEKEDIKQFWFNSLTTIKNKSLLAEQHTFDSFAPRRQQQYAQWLVMYLLFIIHYSVSSD
jgi:hypothetical protein